MKAFMKLAKEKAGEKRHILEQVTDTSKQREGELRNSGVKLMARRMDQLEEERSIEISPADVCKVRVPTLRKQSAEPSAEDAI